MEYNFYYIWALMIAIISALIGCELRMMASTPVQMRVGLGFLIAAAIFLLPLLTKVFLGLVLGS